MPTVRTITVGRVKIIVPATTIIKTALVAEALADLLAIMKNTHPFINH
jgi:hypothetical protein